MVKFNEIEFYPIPSFSGYYYASKCGEIYSLRSNKILKPKIDKDGYHEYTFSIDGKRTTHRGHRLVTTTFIANDNNYPVVNHKNGVKNDNTVNNLEWCSVSHNTRHGFEVLGNEIHNKIGFDIYKHGLIVEKNISKTEMISFLNTSDRFVESLDAFNEGRFTDIIKTFFKFERQVAKGRITSIKVSFNGFLLWEFSCPHECAEHFGVTIHSLHHHYNKTNKILSYQVYYANHQTTIETNSI